MKPKINVSLLIDVEGVVKLDLDKPEEIDEEIRSLCDLLNDIKALLIRAI